MTISKSHFKKLRRLQRRALEKAQAIVSVLKINELPVDLDLIAESEERFLVVKSGDFKGLFDGRLEYHPKQNRFILFYNNKYDLSQSDCSHPRTRFSFAHELGHYFLDHHRAYLMQGGATHNSKGSLFSDVSMEREADAFAAGLLMPSLLVRNYINQSSTELEHAIALAEACNTSILSACIRAIELSDFPCSVFAIKGGRVIWKAVSDAFIEGGCYPRDLSQLPSSAESIWKNFQAELSSIERLEGELLDWFEVYDRQNLAGIRVSQQFVGIPSMGMLVAFVSADESDLDLVECD